MPLTPLTTDTHRHTHTLSFARVRGRSNITFFQLTPAGPTPATQQTIIGIQCLTCKTTTIKSKHMTMRQLKIEAANKAFEFLYLQKPNRLTFRCVIINLCALASASAKTMEIGHANAVFIFFVVRFHSRYVCKMHCILFFPFFLRSK